MALAGVLLACGGQSQPQTDVVAVQSDNRAVLAIVRQALESEAAGVNADSLYAVASRIVANGAERTGPPRYAGVAAGGRVTITDMTGEVQTTTAWALASYRWRSDDERVFESGLATFLLQRDVETGSWRIKHAHSSLLPPWQNQ